MFYTNYYNSQSRCIPINVFKNTSSRLKLVGLELIISRCGLMGFSRNETRLAQQNKRAKSFPPGYIFIRQIFNFISRK